MTAAAIPLGRAPRRATQRHTARLERAHARMKPIRYDLGPRALYSTLTAPIAWAPGKVTRKIDNVLSSENSSENDAKIKALGLSFSELWKLRASTYIRRFTQPARLLYIGILAWIFLIVLRGDAVRAERWRNAEGWYIWLRPWRRGIQALRMTFVPTGTTPAGSTAVGAYGPPEYVFSTDGTTVTATSSVVGLSNQSSTDGGAALTAVFAQLGAPPRGTAYFTRGNYPWGSVPALPRSYAAAGFDDHKWTQILGSRSANIVLSAAGQRFLDCFSKIADDDNWSGIEVAGFNVNAAGQPAATNHAIIGTMTPGGNTVDNVNMYRWWIHDCTAYNVANPKTGTRTGIWIQPSQNGINRATNNFMLDLLVERIRCEGGDSGILIGPVNSAGGTTSGLRVYGGGWRVIDCWHSTGSNNTGGATYPSSNFQLGAQIASASFVTVASMTEPNAAELICHNLYGYGSGDDGLETNGFTNQLHVDCVFEDSWNDGFFTNNFNFLNGIDTTSDLRQRIIYQHCVHRATNVLATNTPRNIGWEMQPSNRDIGEIALLECSFQSKALPMSGANPGPQQIGIFHTSSTNAVIHRFYVRNFNCTFDSITNATANDMNVIAYQFAGRGPTELVVREAKATFAGSRTSTGQIFLFPFQIYGSNYNLDIQGVTIEDNITGRVNDTTRMVEIGNAQFGGANAVVRGRVTNVRLTGTPTDTIPRGIMVYSTATCTITPEFTCELPDLQAIATPSQRMFYGDATNQAKTHVIGGVAHATVVGSDVNTTSNVFANITGLSFAIAANSTWTGEIDLYCVDAGTGGIKFQLTGPAAPTTVIQQVWGNTTAVGTFASEVVSGFATATVVAYCVTITGFVRIKFTIANGNTAGTVQVQLASVTNGQSNTVKIGSRLEARQML